ncbi:MAG: phage holin family protein [Bdellovibrionales bacterium]
MGLIGHWIVSGFALGLTALIVPGFRIRGVFTTLVAVLVLGLANMFVRPVLLFLTFPLTILTLGLFIFVVDAIILRLCAAVLKNFEITNWLSAIVGAMILALTSGVLHWMLI